MRSLVLPGDFGVIPLRYVLAFAGPVTSGARSFLATKGHSVAEVEAKGIVFLASGDAAFMTGAGLVIDGGITAQ